MMKKMYVTAVIALLTGMMTVATASIIVTTTKPGNTAPTVSSTDLGQTAVLSYSTTGTTGTGYVTADGEVQQLFNGVVGNTDGDNADPGETIIAPANTVTINFNVAVNTAGYDITGIFTVAGWNTSGGGRSTQGYEILLTYVNNSTATLVGPTTWEPNTGTVSYFTTVNFTNSGGGVLYSDTVNLNGGGAVAGNSVSASGVKAITFKNFTPAPSGGGGINMYREFDIYGTATAIPEPATIGLVATAGAFLLVFRRHVRRMNRC
jgi:hypothetical protein